MLGRDDVAGLQRLARRNLPPPILRERGLPVDEHLDAALAMAAREAAVVGRAFIAERRKRHGLMDGEMLLVREDRLQHARRRLRFDGAMEVGGQDWPA